MNIFLRPDDQLLIAEELGAKVEVVNCNFRYW